MDVIYNVHEREYPVPAARLGALLEQVAGPESPLWPVRSWPPMILDRPLDAGASGGHGPIRYRCTAYQPGHRAEFTFTVPVVKGTHTFSIRDGRRAGHQPAAARHTRPDARLRQGDLAGRVPLAARRLPGGPARPHGRLPRPPAAHPGPVVAMGPAAAPASPLPPPAPPPAPAGCAQRSDALTG